MAVVSSWDFFVKRIFFEAENSLITTSMNCMGLAFRKSSCLQDEGLCIAENFGVLYVLKRFFVKQLVFSAWLT